ncbi:mitochondrial cardiolipin hydrolase-like [Plodia interpunctella]|uniref:mitochondrial cardiolipin hydrolase-like n=1 Tax=Plodia interpunctella TaxID=58824 RepID=UPI002368EB67|nr:mitochondrial cardiolipin hydrolase-like [Plodia interpunctella]
MRLHPRILSSAAAIAITCVVSAAAYYFKSRSKEINEVMVFCKLQFNAYNCFDKLISYIEAAKRSINVCMPGIHNQAIQGRLLEVLKTKKIAVRIIIDRTAYNESTDFFLKELLDAGAEIKCKANERVHRMQHKFCLVDDEILMTGTLNWGNDRSSDHWNYVYITSKRQLVEPVRQSFYQMWNDFTSDMANLDAYSITSDSGTSDAPDGFKDDEDNNDVIILRESQTTPELCLV